MDPARNREDPGVCVNGTDTTVDRSLPIVTGVSHGPDLTSEPYVTRLKGTDEETEPQGNWMRKQGGGTS